MVLEIIDWSFIIAFFIISLAIGIIVSKQAGSSSKEFFLSGRNMPWWLLGVSMVATTFSADTPNLVADIVRTHGVAGNWAWWAFLLTGMLTVFVYSKLWRRSKVMTDLEFYEIRYSGKGAAFLRGFRAIYLGVFFNIMIMATVSLAAIKIGGIMLGLSPIETLSIASVVTVVYSSLGGLKGVLITDFFQFIVSMVGAVWAAVVIINLPEVGGLDNLIQHERVQDKLDLIPDISNPEIFVPLFLIPIAVQWWSVWYPGSEPGGGGYIAQRMLSAKTERHAIGATFFFNAAHYGLRPWPWILIALASLVVFPDLESIHKVFPNVDSSILRHDLAYPAMLTFLPSGLLGLVVASLVAAFMSTISTHLNWGSSYVVNDFYLRFMKPDASEKELVAVGRISTVLLMIFSAIFALYLSNAMQAFNILLSIGAGTGLIYILRWFWWRINAYTEIAGMVISFVIAIYFEFFHVSFGFEDIPGYLRIIYGVSITTITWLTVTLLTRPADESTLRKFYRLTQPGGPGWKHIRDKARQDDDSISDDSEEGQLPFEILLMFIGCVSVYSTLFAVGYWIYGKVLWASIFTIIASGGGIILFKMWRRIRTIND